MMNIDYQQPHDYPSDTPSRRPMRRPLNKLAGSLGLQIMLDMWDSPFCTFPMRRMYAHEINAILSAYNRLYDEKLIALNLSADGYQLTSVGRYFVGQYKAQIAKERQQQRTAAIRAEQALKRQFEREEKEYWEHSHEDVW